jgi:hypothetical protein
LNIFRMMSSMTHVTAIITIMVKSEVCHCEGALSSPRELRATTTSDVHHHASNLTTL